MSVDPKILFEKTQIINLSETEDKTCPICYENYLENSSSELPRKLPCGHTLGTECLLLWASSRANTSSVICPVCTKPIAYATGLQYIGYATLEYAEEALVRFFSQIARLYTAVDKTLGSRPFFMIFLMVISATPSLYFKNHLALVPCAILYVFMSGSTKNRLATHRYRDLSKLLLIVAFLVGAFLDTGLGRLIFYHAVFPFRSTLKNIYVQHDITIVVLTLGVVVALEDTRHAIGRMVLDAVEHCVVDCELEALMDALGL